MRNLPILLFVAATLGACASNRPTCDGTDRRPINAPVHAQVDYPSCGPAA